MSFMCTYLYIQERHLGIAALYRKFDISMSQVQPLVEGIETRLGPLPQAPDIVYIPPPM